MNRFPVADFVIAAGQFALHESGFEQAKHGKSGLVAPELIGWFLDQLDRTAATFKAVEMQRAASRIESLKDYVTRGDNHPAALVVEARNARLVIEDELAVRKFLRVAIDRAGYLDKDQLFGGPVFTAFPSAARDIKEAGNCLAAECTTAAVFHLMRASEVALRVLAVDRDVQYPDASISTKQVGDLIGSLDLKVRDMRQEDSKLWPSKDIKDAQINFYHRAVVEFRDFNEAWRKHMAHAHEGAFYDREVAHSIYTHVKTFMQVLAEKISETTRTAKYWTS